MIGQPGHPEHAGRLGMNLPKRQAATVRLVLGLARRDIATRYKGSIFGLLWAVATPLLMLGIYAFVFGTVFKSKWPAFSDQGGNFAIILFIGMLVFNIFSDSVSRSPWLITGNVNFVKKVIFPVHVLPVVAIMTALFNFLMGMLAWVLMALLSGLSVHPSYLLLPLVIVPVVLVAAAGSWFFSALGVYFRDVSQFIGLMIMALMFASPVFYPLEAVPARFRFVFESNPLAISIDAARAVMIAGTAPDYARLLAATLVSAVLAYAGLRFFRMCSKGFSDAL